MIYGAVVTFFAFRNSQSVTKAPTANELFKSQNAIIEGQINSVSGKKLFITNRKGVKGSVELSDSVSINDLDNPLSAPSSDLKNIKTNKDASIYLNMINGSYLVTNISYQLFTPDITLPSQPQTGESTNAQPQATPDLSIINKPVPPPPSPVAPINPVSTTSATTN